MSVVGSGVGIGVGIGRAVSAAVSRLDPDGSNTSTALAPARLRGRVRLWAPEAKTTVTTEHQERPKVMRERAGGWRIVERQGQLSATTWDGSPPLQLQLKLILDGKTGRATPVSVEDLQDRIRLLGYKVPSLGRPPRIRVIGAVPYASGGVLLGASSAPPWWVLEALDFTDQDSTDAGEVSQTVATVTLLEHVDSTVESQSVKQDGYAKYRWKQHDTLSAVADDQLGDEDLAQWIRDANPAQTKHGWSKVAAGTVIRIPRLKATTS